jgi:hypothetical protein
MKNSFFIMIVMFWSLGISAQDQNREQDRVRLQDSEYLMYQDGEMLQVRQGTQTRLQSQLKLADGTMANPDGTIQLKDQKRLQLRDGECLDMDGNRYENQERYNQMLSQLGQNDHYMMKNGEMYQVQAGVRTQMQNQMTLKNGTVIDPNGTVQMKNKEQYRLRDGEYLDNLGERYQTRERFKMMLDRREPKGDMKKTPKENTKMKRKN